MLNKRSCMKSVLSRIVLREECVISALNMVLFPQYRLIYLTVMYCRCRVSSVPLSAIPVWRPEPSNIWTKVTKVSKVSQNSPLASVVTGYLLLLACPRHLYYT